MKENTHSKHKGAKKLQEKIRVKLQTVNMKVVNFEGQTQKVKRFDEVTILLKLSNEE